MSQTTITQLLTRWEKPEDIPIDADYPVLVLCTDELGTKCQYVCWPPDGDIGWLMCLPDECDVDFDISKMKNSQVIGWKRLSR